MRRRFLTILATLGLSVVSVFATSGSAVGHGYTDAPVSRQKQCNLGVVTNCGQVQWEPQSVEGPKGFPSGGPANGRLCSGGNSRFHELDDMRNGTWPTTSLTAGQGYGFTWRFTAPHRTSKFHYYITRDGWNPTQPLTRAALETQPFMTVTYNGTQPSTTTVHQGTVPTQKSGRHIIYAVWDVYDTSNAFYACSDVQIRTN